MPELWSILPTSYVLGGLMSIMKHYTFEYYAIFMGALSLMVGLAYGTKYVFYDRKK